jgi:hypothetical protein
MLRRPDGMSAWGDGCKRAKRTVFAEKVGDGLMAQIGEVRQSFLETDAGHQGIETFNERFEAAGRLRADGWTV